MRNNLLFKSMNLEKLEIAILKLHAEKTIKLFCKIVKKMNSQPFIQC